MNILGDRLLTATEYIVYAFLRFVTFFIENVVFHSSRKMASVFDQPALFHTWFQEML